MQHRAFETGTPPKSRVGTTYALTITRMNVLKQQIPHNSQKNSIYDAIRLVVLGLKYSGSIDGGKMLTSRGRALFLSLALMFVCALQPRVAFAQKSISVDVQNMPDTTHLEFSGRSSWNYDLRKSKKKKDLVVFTVSALSSDAIKKLKTLRDDVIRKVEVINVGVDGKYEVHFFLKNSTVNHFDYLTEEPSRLIVDFYLAPEKKNKEKIVKNTPKHKKPKSLKVKKRQKTQIVKAKNSRKKTRSPAGTDYILAEKNAEIDLKNQPMRFEKKNALDLKHGIFDGADPKIQRFRIKDKDINPLALQNSKRNIYLRFPVLDLQLPYLQVLWKNPPKYKVLAEENKENKIVRLLVRLFEDKNIAMFDKSMKFFREQYPESKYMEIVDYMEADLHYHRWRESGSLNEFEAAMIKYRQIIERYPNSALLERTYMLVGYSYLKRKDAFTTLRMMQKFLTRRPNTKFRDKAELAIADSFLRLNRFKEAIKTYRKVAKNGKYLKNRIEANYLVGDAYYKKGDYKTSAREFEEVYRKFPTSWKNYPNAKFHLPESHFWLGNYKKSMDGFIDFLQRFPDHKFGGYAMTRLGELLEIFGAPQKRVLGAFLEGYFRYRDTPGGALARVRVLTAKMKDMKAKELAKAEEELSEIIKKSDLNKVDQFVVVKQADGFYERRNFQRSNDVLISFYQKNPTKTNFRVFNDRIIRNITSQVKEHLQTNKFLHALKEISRHKDAWLKKADRIDLQFYTGQAYEMAGVYDESEKEYRTTLNRLYALKGTQELRERGYLEDIPSADTLNLRLAAVSAKDSNYPKSNNFLKEIDQPDKMTPYEQIELVELAAKISEERGQIGTAKNFLKKASENWKGQPEMVMQPYLKLAQLQYKSQKYTKALDTIQKIENLVVDAKTRPDEKLFKALELKAKMQTSMKRKSAAIKTYRKIISLYQGEKDLKVTRYKAGKLLFDQGKVKEAKDIWQGLNEDKGFWNNLALEEAEDVEWNGKYKKYLSRIPAMEGFSE